MILVLGGTKEGKEAAARLISRGKKVKISVTTEYGASLLKGLEAEVIVSKLNPEKLRDILDSQEIKVVVDATHPFAEKITEAAIAACDDEKADYVRYERPRIDFPPHLKVIKVENYQQAADAAKNFDRILLTTGSKNLKKFVQSISRAQERLHIRILPLPEFLQRTISTGISPDNIIAMKGPFSSELNRAILGEYNIDVLVTKASGKTGGLPAKLEAASLEETPVIIISRPDYNFPRVVNTGDELIEMLKLLT